LKGPPLPRQHAAHEDPESRADRRVPKAFGRLAGRAGIWCSRTWRFVIRSPCWRPTSRAPHPPAP